MYVLLDGLINVAWPSGSLRSRLLYPSKRRSLGRSHLIIPPKGCPGDGFVTTLKKAGEDRLPPLLPIFSGVLHNFNFLQAELVNSSGIGV
jgi:hypothetical protein